MKKIGITVGIIILLILFFPIRYVYKDGGSIRYKALLYEVTKHHKIIPCNCATPKYETGITIKLLNKTVYENITNPLINEESEKEEEPKEKMLMLENTLYYNTGMIVTEGRCGVGIEEIKKFVPETEEPTHNEEINFRGGIKYQRITDTRVDVLIKEAWYQFERKN